MHVEVEVVPPCAEPAAMADMTALLVLRVLVLVEIPAGGCSGPTYSSLTRRYSDYYDLYPVILRYAGQCESEPQAASHGHGVIMVRASTVLPGPGPSRRRAPSQPESLRVWPPAAASARRLSLPQCGLTRTTVPVTVRLRVGPLRLARAA
eukprot:2820145-Rhodomonas_salina.1